MPRSTSGSPTVHISQSSTATICAGSCGLSMTLSSLKSLCTRVAGRPATLVHNDFKLDNVMLNPQEPAQIVAVLDWEMCTVGDPLVDLGILLCYWAEKDDPEDRREAISPVTVQPGWMTRAEI